MEPVEGRTASALAGGKERGLLGEVTVAEVIWRIGRQSEALEGGRKEARSSQSQHWGREEGKVPVTNRTVKDGLSASTILKNIGSTNVRASKLFAFGSLGS